MGHHTIILMFGILSLMSSYGCVNSTKIMIKEIGINEKFYPQQYIMPHRKIRRIFNLKKREIPKWLYFQLFMSMVFVGLFLFSTTIYLGTDGNKLLAVILIYIYILLMSADLIYFLICAAIYKRKRR